MAFWRRRRAAAVEEPAEQVAAVDEAALIAQVTDRDLSAPVALRHVMLTNDPAAAEALAVAVREAGYDVRIDTHDGGWTWIVAASETALLTPSHAASARAALGSLARRHRAEYEGWDLVTPP